VVVAEAVILVDGPPNRSSDIIYRSLETFSPTAPLEEQAVHSFKASPSFTALVTS
jgi:hypothetical protein